MGVGKSRNRSARAVIGWEEMDRHFITAAEEQLEQLARESK